MHVRGVIPLQGDCRVAPPAHVLWHLLSVRVSGLGLSLSLPGPNPETAECSGLKLKHVLHAAPHLLPFRVSGLQGYLAHKKQPPPRTLQ